MQSPTIRSWSQVLTFVICLTECLNYALPAATDLNELQNSMSTHNFTESTPTLPVVKDSDDSQQNIRNISGIYTPTHLEDNNSNDSSLKTINISSNASTTLAPITVSTENSIFSTNRSNSNATTPASVPVTVVESSISFNTTTTKSVVGQTPLPPDCSQRELKLNQPVNTPDSKLKKCCPLGESLDIYRENQSDSICDSSQALSFEPNIISAMIYDNCIEDNEIEISLPYEIGNPCNTSFLYDNTEESLYVLQDGSLLIMDIHGNDSFAVRNNYCIDMDKSGKMFAFVCITQVEEHLARSQIITVAVLMLISMPCLLTVSYLHISLRQLRTLNGLSLSLMSLCLAAGYFVHSAVHIYGLPSGGAIGYIIQFCILSYFFWFFCLCCNVLLNIWIKLPYNIQLTKHMAYINFSIYCIFAFSVPVILVSLTVQKGLQGMPSYFIQGLTESIRESQRYFIPPVSTILGLSFLVMVGAFFGFQRIKNKGYLPAEKEELPTNAAPSRVFDQQRYEEVKKDAKCISLLGIIMIVTWMLEIVTFYSPGPEGYLILCDMINGLQGVFVLLIFLVVRRRRTIILRWWYDRGSHSIESGTELHDVAKTIVSGGAS